MQLHLSANPNGPVFLVMEKVDLIVVVVIVLSTCPLCKILQGTYYNTVVGTIWCIEWRFPSGIMMIYIISTLASSSLSVSPHARTDGQTIRAESCCYLLRICPLSWSSSQGKKRKSSPPPHIFKYLLPPHFIVVQLHNTNKHTFIIDTTTHDHTTLFTPLYSWW